MRRIAWRHGRRPRLGVAVFASLLALAGPLVPAAPAGAAVPGGWETVSATTGDSLNGVGCASATQCFAVGGDPSGGVIKSWQGGGWSPVPLPGTPSAFQAVACASSTTCFAIGSGPTYAWNGTSWSALSSPSDLSDISCPSASFCMAVGVDGVETWSGDTWAAQIAAGGSFYSHLACTSATNCWAFNPVSASHWDGTTWTTASLASVFDPMFSGVACAAASECFAVGMAVPNSLIEEWNGTQWSQQYSPNPSFNNLNQFNGVACAAANECFAVGDFIADNSLAGGSEEPLVADWDGSSWTQEPVQLSNQASLNAVACASVSVCFAVGATYGGATAGDVIAEYSPSFTNGLGPGLPTQLQFTNFPAGSWAGTGPFPVSVALEDASGTTVTSSTANVSLSIASGGAPGASLACTPGSSAPAVAGVATFSCSIDLVGQGYVLEATSGALSTTVTFDVVPAPDLAPTISPLVAPSPPPIPSAPYPSVTYGSGGVIHNPRIVLLFIGSSWCPGVACQVGGPTGSADSPTGLEDSLVTLFSHLSGSLYANLLSTYYDQSGYINSDAFQLVGSYVYPQDLGYPDTTEAGWNSLVAQDIVPLANQSLGITNTPDTVYVAVFGPNQLRALAISGAAGCADNGLSDGVNLANIPVPPTLFPSQDSGLDTGGAGCTMGAHPGLSLVDAVDGLASHEVAELVTSRTNQGWTAKVPPAPKVSGARQVADVCENAAADWDVLGGPGVAALWDPVGSGSCATREYLSTAPTLTGEVPSATGNAITVSWQPVGSSDSLLPVWGYRVTLDQVGAGPVATWDEGTSVTSATISGLSGGGSQYTLSVAELIGGGVGQAATTGVLSPNGPLLLATGTSTVPGGLATSSNGTATATAIGQGTVSVSGYPADPYSTQPVSGAATPAPSYFDVHASAGSSFTRLTITACGYQSLSWYNGTEWQLVSNQSVDANGCVVAVLTSSTTPSIAELTGTVFASTAGLAITPSVPTIGLPDAPISSVATPVSVVTPPLGPFPVPAPTTTTSTRPPLGMTRLAGANRVATAIAISQARFPAPGSAGAVVLATADAYPDALVAGPLAVAKRAPLLLSGPNTLDPATAAEIQRVLAPGGLVYLVGGSAALGSALDQELAALGFSTQRLAGADRYQTAVAVAEALDNPSTVFEADGTDFADALSAAPPAAELGGAVLLTNGGAQAPATARYLSAHPGTRYAVGGPAAQADPVATPLVGADRYATAALVAARFFPTVSAAAFATGLNFPDALVGGAYAGEGGEPLLLIPPQGPLPSPVVNWITADTELAGATVLGGPAAVSDAVLNSIGAAP